jgi:hypothetical protein
VPDPEQITADRIARETSPTSGGDAYDDYIDSIINGGGGGYKTYTAPDGPHGAGLRPGTIYSVGADDNWTIKYTPPAGSSGGSGSSSPTNVYISQNPGELYTDRISDGSDGYPPVTTTRPASL